MKLRSCLAILSIAFLAGLLHAAYKFGSFAAEPPGITPSKRQCVRAVIGEEAEDLEGLGLSQMRQKIIANVLFHIDAVGQAARGVALIGEEHQVIRLARLDERIDQPRRVPEMHIFID